MKSNMRLILFVLASSIACSTSEIILATGDRQYSFTYWQAYLKCASIGASLANPQEIENARSNGYSSCSCGWLADRTARYPTTESVQACGGRPGVHFCDWQDRWNAYCFVGDWTGNCSRPLGMESGMIKNVQLTSSSTYHTFWTERWSAPLARLNRQGIVNAWMPHHDGRNQYIEVDLEHPMAVTGIVTQGVKRYMNFQYVTQYKISYSKDGDFWVYYSDDRVPTIFNGNHDNNGHVRNMFKTPILAQYLRIHPHHWVRHISLRFELLGCDMNAYDSALERRRETEVLTERFVGTSEFFNE